MAEDRTKTMMLTTGKGKALIAKPVKQQGRRASERTEPRPFKGMVYGESGMGKTYIVVMLLQMGFRVLYFSTEMGGDGLRTVESALKKLGREDLLANLYEAPAFIDYEEVSDFLQAPASRCPSLWEEFKPEFIFWDGFSEFQLLYLERYIADQLLPDNPRDERDAGLFLVEKDWNMVMNGTLRGSHDFFQIRDPQTGREPHKIITCKQAEKERDAVPGVDGKPAPMKAKKTFILQGAAKKIFEGAFDFIFLATKREGLKPGEPPTFTWRVQSSEKQTAKFRGGELAFTEKEIPADFAALWSRLGLPLLETKEVKS